MKKRRKFSPEFKSKVALEALRERDPVHEIAKRYQVHPSQVSDWKKALLSAAGSVFESERSRDDEALRRKLKTDRLYKQIGHLQVQVDFLKEACDHFGVGVSEEQLDQLR